jgi:hypothetical protein
MGLKRITATSFGSVKLALQRLPEASWDWDRKYGEESEKRRSERPRRAAKNEVLGGSPTTRLALVNSKRLRFSPEPFVFSALTALTPAAPTVPVAPHPKL